MVPASTTPKKRDEPPKQRFMRRKAMLWSERASWVPDYLELVDYVAPSAGRFYTLDANRGDKVARSKRVNDSTGRRSLRVMAAGFQAGMSSPARPWFRLSTGDLELDKNHDVRVWLRAVEVKMRTVFSTGNTYRVLHQLYVELGAFGTACAVMLPDFDNVVHMMPLTVGSYALASDGKNKITCLVRETSMTVGQLVDTFGYDKCSEHVKNLYDRETLDVWVRMEHVIEPRASHERKAGSALASSKKFRSVYYEVGAGSAKHDGLLRDSGFDVSPILAPRWEVNENDVYGTGPGHEVLPAIRELQHGKLRKAQVIDYQSNPPLAIPSSLKEAGVNRLPGGNTYVDTASADNSIRTLFDVKLDIAALREDIADVREQIKQHFFEDLFLMMANDTRSGVTATEVAERHEEKLLMLGPVMERMENELFDPLIDFTFNQLEAAGALPPPPPVLQGRKLSVEYIGLLAQAQRAVALKSVDRLVSTISSIAGATQDPGVWDNLDTDKVVQGYSDGLGVDPNFLRDPKVRDAMRAERAKQQQAQQALAAAEQAANAGAVASQIDPQNMQDVMGMLQGYGSPTGVEVGQ